MRFSIRDLLWLMVVVALAVGWRVQRAELASVRKEHAARLEQLRIERVQELYRAALRELERNPPPESVSLPLRLSNT